MTDSTPDAPLDLSKPQRVPTTPPVAKKRRKRPRRPKRPRLLDDGLTIAGIIWLALVALPCFFVWLDHPVLPSPADVGGVLAVSIWPLGLIAWGAFEWLRDLGDYRDELEQWRDDVAEWEFERRLDASRA